MSDDCLNRCERCGAAATPIDVVECFWGARPLRLCRDCGRDEARRIMAEGERWVREARKPGGSGATRQTTRSTR